MLSDKPQFTCDSYVTFDLYDADVNLTCLVHANPEVQDFNVTFPLKSERVEVIVGSGNIGRAYRTESAMEEVSTVAPNAPLTY